MFKEHFKKYRFAFIRSLLTLYPFMLTVDGLIAKRNTWYTELWLYLTCAFLGFVAGISYEGYFFNRQSQKEYPTRKRFNQVAAISAAAGFFILYGLLQPVDEVARIVYCLSGAFAIFLFMRTAFFAREAKRGKFTIVISLTPVLISVVLLYIVFPQARKLYGNVAVLTLVLHIAFIAIYYTDVLARLKSAYEKLKDHKRAGKFIKKWSDFFNKLRKSLGDRLSRVGRALKSLTFNRFLLRKVKKLLHGIYRFFYKDKETKVTKYNDYTDEISTLFAYEDPLYQERYTVHGLYKIKNPVRKVRYAFGLVMSDLVEKKVGIKFYDTVNTIGEKSKVIDDLDRYMDPLCDIYQDVRYGPGIFDGQISEEAALLAVSADDIIKESYYNPKVFANSNFQFEGSDQS